MKLVNGTEINLKIYVGMEDKEEPEGVIELKAHQEVKVDDGSKEVWVISLT